MGMGYGANFAIVASETDVEKIAPVEFEAWSSALKQNNILEEEWAQYVSREWELDTGQLPHT